MHLDAIGRRDPIEHVAPVVVTGGGVVAARGVAVVPFLAGDLGADLVGHHRAVMGQVADGEATGLEAPGPGAQDHRPGPNGDGLFGVEPETRRPRDPSVLLDEMRDDHPFEQRNLALVDGPHEGTVGQRLIEVAPVAQLARAIQRMLGQLAGVDRVVRAEGRTRDGGDEIVDGPGFGRGIENEEPLGEGRQARGAQPPLRDDHAARACVMRLHRGEEPRHPAADHQHVGGMVGIRDGVHVDFDVVVCPGGQPERGQPGGRARERQELASGRGGGVIRRGHVEAPSETGPVRGFFGWRAPVEPGQQRETDQRQRDEKGGHGDVGMAAQFDRVPKGQYGEGDGQPAMEIPPAAIAVGEPGDQSLAEIRGHGQHQQQKPCGEAQQDAEAVEGGEHGDEGVPWLHPRFEIARQHDQDRMQQDHADRGIGDVSCGPSGSAAARTGSATSRCCAPGSTGQASSKTPAASGSRSTLSGPTGAGRRRGRRATAAGR